MAVKENSLFLAVSPETGPGSETEQPQDLPVSQRLLQLHSTNSSLLGFTVCLVSVFYSKHFTPYTSSVMVRDREGERQCPGSLPKLSSLFGAFHTVWLHRLVCVVSDTDLNPNK